LCARPDAVVSELLEFCKAKPRGPVSLVNLVRSRASVLDPYVSRYEAAINRQTAQYRQRFGV
jgi:hypothetical protein